ncbi:MAG: hypothetical protein LBR26_13910 [Prevotella sp.]|jgi:hypothetical protein|nr:hypothetical protein [Prevotella sp.]
MKTRYLFIIGCMLFTLFNNSLTAQDDKIEKTIDGETYSIDTVMNIITNKKNGKLPDRGYCEHVYLENFSSVDDVVRKIFSKARMNELIKLKTRFKIAAYCDISGKIEEVSFLLLKKDNPITLTEVYLLEKNMKGVKVKIKSNCPDVKYYSVSKTYRFEDHFAK